MSVSRKLKPNFGRATRAISHNAPAAIDALLHSGMTAFLVIVLFAGLLTACMPGAAGVLPSPTFPLSPTLDLSSVTNTPSSPDATPAEPAVIPDVTLLTGATTYPTSNVDLTLTFTNESDQPVYLGVCGPWEIVKTAGIDESPPVWFIACEIDYLGRMVDPGQRIEDNLTLQLEPGSYLVQVDVFWECVLGEPKRISPTETYYGEFRDCAGRSQILSAPFEVR